MFGSLFLSHLSPIITLSPTLMLMPMLILSPILPYIFLDLLPGDTNVEDFSTTLEHVFKRIKIEGAFEDTESL